MNDFESVSLQFALGKCSEISVYTTSDLSKIIGSRQTWLNIFKSFEEYGDSISFHTNIEIIFGQNNLKYFLLGISRSNIIKLYKWYYSTDKKTGKTKDVDFRRINTKLTKI
jgi:hypothetical protein